MKNGFTLIELLAVVAIIGVISSIAFITVDRAIKGSTNRLYQSQVEAIYDGAEAWVIDNMNIVSDKEFYCIKLSELQEKGYVDKDLVNPKEDKKFDGNLTIKITDNISGYKYSIDEIEGCS